MSTTLAQRIHGAIRRVLDAYPGAWLVWCDPRGDWAPLLEGLASDTKLGGFSLLVVGESTGGAVGSPLLRRQLQERLDAHDPLVLLVRAGEDDLGWLWSQALLAEHIYGLSLREQLLAWGWRPQSLTTSDDELAALARQYRDQDPQEWSGGGLQPDPALLVRILAGIDEPHQESRLVLDATIEATGMPPLDTDNLPRWRTRALARLLTTQAHQAAPALIGAGHELLIAPAQRGQALALLDRWTDSVSLRGRLATAIAEADRIAALGTGAGVPPAGSEPFLSRTAELAAFSATCRDIASLSGRGLLQALAAQAEDLRRRAEGFWGKDWPGAPAIPWIEAARLATAARMVLETTPSGEWSTPEQGLEWYVTGGWRMDRAGEGLLRMLPQPHPDLIALIAPLREAYRNRWESLLMRWSATWSAAGCPTVALPSAGDWLRGVLEKAGTKTPTAVIVVDALRYDLGATIAERLNEREGAHRADVAPARAPLPSVTALGMALSLPIPEADLDAELASGTWQIRQRGRPANLSDAEERRAWWQAYGGAGTDALLPLAGLIEGQIPAPSERRRRLVIHTDALDKLGHDDELETQGAEPVIERYLSAIARLHEAGWQRILMVTDHGYIHWDGAAERQVPPPAPDALYTNRRALAYPAATSLPAPQALAPGGRYRIALPSGASCFRAYGGHGYYHGGASLQEWIIPCVRIEWPAKAVPLGVELVPLAKILSLKVRVTLAVIRVGIFPEDALPRRVTVVIRDAARGTILFRSPEVSVTPDLHMVSVTLEPTAEPATRGTEVRIQVRDAANDEVISGGESVLMVEKDDWADAPPEW